MMPRVPCVEANTSESGGSERNLFEGGLVLRSTTAVHFLQTRTKVHVSGTANWHKGLLETSPQFREAVSLSSEVQLRHVRTLACSLKRTLLCLGLMRFPL